ncbi:nectin-3-like protein [Narcine bancroftii]|uniref:nectin-3-like protein n=1 Tax=Narcine bancroftii TaxID=1343680 RepID=UPI00383163B1
MGEKEKPSHPPVCLFTLLNLVQALQGITIDYDPKVTAAPGVNVTLKCIISGQEKSSVVQIQWSRVINNHVNNILIVNGNYGIHHFLDSVDFESPSPIKGMANLFIRNVQVSASGTYTCSVNTFPEGSFKVSIILTVAKKAELTIPQIYEEMKYFAPDKLHLKLLICFNYQIWQPTASAHHSLSKIFVLYILLKYDPLILNTSPLECDTITI